MATILNSQTLPQFNDTVSRDFKQMYTVDKPVFRGSGIAQEETVDIGTGQYRIMTEYVDTDLYAAMVAEGAEFPRSRVSFGYEKALQVGQYGRTITITALFRQTEKYQKVLNYVLDLLPTGRDRLDLDLTHRLTFGFATSYTNMDGITVDTTTADGYQLIYNAHLLRGSATTYSNQITGNPAFSKTALEVAISEGQQNTYTNLGQRVAFMPNTIITSNDPTTVNRVAELFRATADINSANANTYNAFGGGGAFGLRHIILPRLATDARGQSDSTKIGYWFLADTNYSAMFLGVLQEFSLTIPTIGSNAEDFFTKDLAYRVDGVYGITIVSARWIRGSTGLGV